MDGHPMRREVPHTRDIKQILRHYHIGHLTNVVGSLGGIFCANMKIRTTRGEYVVRVLPGFASSNHIVYERHISNLLRKAGVPAVEYVLSTHEKPYSRWAGRKVEITRFVESEPFTGTSRQVISSGATLRRFHRALRHAEDGPKPKWSNHPSEYRMRHGLQQMNDMRDMLDGDAIDQLQHLYRRVLRKWANVKQGLPTTIIHGDWHPWNLLYKSSGQVSCVLDFDFIRRAPRLNDVGYALWMLHTKRDGTNAAHDFLSGYGPLRSVERDALALAIARASLFSVCTAPYLFNPVASCQLRLASELPFLEWILSADGKRTVRNWCK